MTPADVSAPSDQTTREARSVRPADVAKSKGKELPPVDAGSANVNESTRWLEDNHAASRAYIDDVEANGVFSDDLCCF
jgi:hypothetical protein